MAVLLFSCHPYPFKTVKLDKNVKAQFRWYAEEQQYRRDQTPLPKSEEMGIRRIVFLDEQPALLDKRTG